MKLWMKKVSVILITFMTLGMYIPPTYLNTNDENDEVVSAKTNVNDDVFKSITEIQHEGDIDFTDTSEANDERDSSDYFISMITEQAKEQTVSKLGARIVNQVEADFMRTILPSMEDVLKTILVEAGEEELQYYGIAEEPTQGYGERIFNIHDYQTKLDVARFHVRRDNRPGEGYWFNFHYHLRNDGFEEHHNIGEIYWDKNTPPKWMA